MDVRIEKEAVKGGTLVRDASTGELLSVHTDKTDSYVDAATREAVKRQSVRHQDALRRLVDR